MLIGALLISGSLYITQPADNTTPSIDDEKNEEGVVEEKDLAELVNCLQEEGVVIYGSRTCPACAQLVDSFGGSDVVAPIYVECLDEADRCSEEKMTGFVPEIQIDGEVYEQGWSPADIADAAGCEF